MAGPEEVVGLRGPEAERFRLRDEVRPNRLVPSLTAGIVTGVLEVVVATSFAALIFSGPLRIHLSSGIGLALFAAVAIMAILAITSSLPGVVGSTQDVSAAVLSLIAASIAADLPAREHGTFLTVVLAIAVTAILAAGFFFLLGTFRLGDLVRFVPYPVVGGFLAGTGWLLFRGGFEVVSGTPLTLGTLSEIFEAGVLARWAAGLAFAVVLLLVTRRSGHVLIVPGGVLAGIAIFFVLAALRGASIGELEHAGWVLGPFEAGGLWQPWTLEALGEADWRAVVGQAGNIATLLIVSVLGLLLNASGIELAVNRDLDLNRELRSAGVANLAAGLGGGIVGYQALSITALAHRMGSRSRLVGLLAAALCLTVMTVGADILSLFPRPVVGGLLLFVGLGFLVEWVVDSWSRLPRSEYLIVLLILAIIAILGFLPGVGVGLALAVALFAVDYGRTEPVKHALTGRTYRSHVDRPPHQRRRLHSEGERVHILELQGFLFFGTANALLDRIRRRADDREEPALRFLILDFRRVSGVDSSVVLSFTKGQRLAEARGFTLVLAGASERVRRQLEQGGIGDEGSTVRYFPDLDRGIEWCENELLGGETAPAEGEPQWRAALGAGEGVDEEALMVYLERMEVPAGQTLIRQGDDADDVYLLESGRLTVEVATGDGKTVRLRTMGPGTVVGELTLYLGGTRNASVVTDGPSVVYRLRRSALEDMERRDPQMAATLHRLFARLLAERLAHNVETIKALLD